MVVEDGLTGRKLLPLPEELRLDSGVLLVGIES
jgi:hypothetical protein